MRENEISATCYSEGSYELVVYCSGCNIEILRTTETIPTSGHSFDKWLSSCIFCGFTTTSEGLSYAINSDGTGWTVIGLGTFSGKNLVIPDTHVGLPVTEIAPKAFKGISGIESVVIGNNITHIGDEAFMNLTGLKRLKTGESLLTLGKHTFKDCTNLTEIYYNSDNLWSEYEEQSAYLINYYEYFALNPFDNCGSNGEGIKVTVANNVSRIPSGLFIADLFGDEFTTYVNITEVDFEDDGICTSIGSYAFMGCINLHTVTLCDTIREIENYVFILCDDLIYNEYDTASYIGTKDNPYFALIKPIFRTSYPADEGYISREPMSLNIHNDTILLCDRALEYCAIEEITIPIGLLSIGQNAFYGIEEVISNFDGLDVYISNLAAWCEMTPGCFVGDIYLNGELLTDLVIPDGVTFVGGAFHGCKSITGVVIPDSVETVLGGAFQACKNLRSVDIGDGVSKIDEYTFSGCGNLLSVVLGNNITSIDPYVFYGCEKLIEVVNHSALEITAGSEEYGRIAFNAKVVCEERSEILYVNDFGFYTHNGIHYLVEYVGNDTDLVLPDDYYGESYEVFRYAFASLEDIVSVKISGGVTYIGDSAFCYCTAIRNVEFINNQCKFGKGVFLDCTELVNIELPSSLYEIPENMFVYCRSLESIVIPEGVSVIGDGAFANCGLVRVVIPDSVTEIRDNAFSRCSSLVTVTVGSGVTSVSNNSFEDCQNLVEVINKSTLNLVKGSDDYGCVAKYAKIVHNGDSKVVTIDDYLFFSYDGVNLLVGYAGDDSDLVLPSDFNGNTYEIYHYAFYDNDIIRSVIIPDSVTSIGQAAFESCDLLSEITIGKGVEYIGSYAFAYTNDDYINVYISDMKNWCQIEFDGPEANPIGYDIKGWTPVGSLYLNGVLVTELVVPDGVIEISDYAFCGYERLTAVEIPDSVTKIGYHAFSECSNLTKVIINNENTTIMNGAFFKCSDAIFNEYGNAFYLGSEDNPYAFLVKGKRGCVYCVVHNDTITICSGAFEGVNLYSITLGKNVKTIGNNAFSTYYSDVLEVVNNSNLDIKAGSLDYGRIAFNAKEVHTGESKIVNVKDYLFYAYGEEIYLIGYVGNDKELVLPESYYGNSYTIYYGAFYGSEITSVTISGGARNVGYGAFSNCVKLENVITNYGVNRIEGFAFGNCINLKNLTVSSSVNYIGHEAFFSCNRLRNIFISDMEKWCAIKTSGIAFYSPRSLKIHLNGVVVENAPIPGIN